VLSDIQNSNDTIAYLRSPRAIRERCRQLFELACSDKLRYFRCDLSQLDRTSDYVIQVTKENYPDLNIPFHSRWRHFEAGGISRSAIFEEKLSGLTPVEKARAKFDLVITSVLLDAGAGAAWQYKEPGTDQHFQRSEGLAVASFHLFCDGVFSSVAEKPLQADTIALQQLTKHQLSKGFQVTNSNPLVGLQGRVDLLNRLGQTLPLYPDLFGTQLPRPGNLVDYLLEQSKEGQLQTQDILSAVLTGFGDIWPGRITFNGVNLGDVWPHTALSKTDDSASSSSSDSYALSLIPFHKLSQWLTYSLLEPLQELGLKTIGLDNLTGLPEYRNGGLCTDLGLLQIKQPDILKQIHLPGSEVIVEWRALTVILLDRIADAVRHQLAMTIADLPLAKILQGGTWAAGRQIAAELRTDGVPPIQIESDGTVF